MFEIKPISQEARTDAMAKAERYRLLNEPLEAESICRDILETDPENQEALVMLFLALSDQLREHINPSFSEAQALLEQMDSEYKRNYYEGVLYERRGKVHFKQMKIGSGHIAYDWFVKAMASYERAQELRPAGNDSSILRWNTIARILNRHPELVPASGSGIAEHMLE